jgi:hypothetical protein
MINRCYSEGYVIWAAAVGWAVPTGFLVAFIAWRADSRTGGVTFEPASRRGYPRRDKRIGGSARVGYSHHLSVTADCSRVPALTTFGAGEKIARDEEQEQ